MCVYLFVCVWVGGSGGGVLSGGSRATHSSLTVYSSSSMVESNRLASSMTPRCAEVGASRQNFSSSEARAARTLVEFQAVTSIQKVMLRVSCWSHALPTAKGLLVACAKVGCKNNACRELRTWPVYTTLRFRTDSAQPQLDFLTNVTFQRQTFFRM